MGFRLENVGRWSPDVAFHVEREHVQAYAAATNDELPLHLTGEVAPPNYAVVLLPLANESVRAEDVVLDLTPDEAMRVLHGEQELVSHQPIRPGMDLLVRTSTRGVQAKGANTLVVNCVEARLPDGAPVATQYVSLFYRDVPTVGSAGELAPAASRPVHEPSGPPLTRVVQKADADQTYRYADASGDRMAIHLDDGAARGVGLPGIILHGLCTMAFASRAVVETAGGDSTRLRRLAVRFSSVATPGQELTTRIWAAGPGSYSFDTADAQGQPVLTRGWAELA